jgi:F0F1-type ATP synthase assembly protein I
MDKTSGDDGRIKKDEGEPRPRSTGDQDEPGEPVNEQLRQATANAALGFQIAGLIACSVFGSLFLGIWLDRRLGIAPCAMIVMMVLGVVVAIVGAYDLVKRMNT